MRTGGEQDLDPTSAATCALLLGPFIVPMATNLRLSSSSTMTKRASVSLARRYSQTLVGLCPLAVLSLRLQRRRPTSCPSCARKSKPLGAIIGGAVGGYVTVIVIVSLLMFWRRRRQLRDATSGRLRVPKSPRVGTAEGLRKTTKWVMQRGILGQFRGARDALYSPSLSLSPAQD